MSQNMPFTAPVFPEIARPVPMLPKQGGPMPEDKHKDLEQLISVVKLQSETEGVLNSLSDRLQKASELINARGIFVAVN